MVGSLPIGILLLSCAITCSYCSQRLDQLSTPIDTLDLKNCRLDNRSCEALEAVLSRMHMTTIDLERTSLEDDVSYTVLKLEVSIFKWLHIVTM